MKTTFVIGAGFSVEEQFPLVRGLKERVIHFVEAEQHSSYAGFLRPRDNWPEFPKGLFYTGLDEVDPDGTLGFEELLIAVRQANERGQASIVDSVLRIGVSRLLWCITYFIWQVGTPYLNFARRLAASQNDSAVVSFNWDLLIERALSDIGQEWSYSAETSNSVPIIKPHGSINWSSHAQNPNLTPGYNGWRPIGPESTLSFDGRNSLANPDKQMINPDLMYCIFPGDPDLPETHQDLRRLWGDVETVIARSESVVFVGYSLPSYDRYAREKLANLVSSKHVEIIDPCEEALAAFVEVIPHAQPICKTFGACQYAQAITAG